jgi:hypothetical protein
MLESGLSGSVRGVPSNGHPYCDPRPEADTDMRSRWVVGPARIRFDRYQDRHQHSMLRLTARGRER